MLNLFMLQHMFNLLLYEFGFIDGFIPIDYNMSWKSIEVTCDGPDMNIMDAFDALATL